MGELVERILSHSEYFNEKLELVPYFVYFGGQSQPSNENNGFVFKKSGTQSYKIKSKSDTENGTSTPKMKESDQMEEEEEEEKEEEEEQLKHNLEEKVTQKYPISQNTDNTTDAQQPDILPGFIDSQIVTEREELKKKLRERLNALRAKRNAPPISDDTENTVEPPSKKRKVEEKKSKKKKKQKGTPTKQTSNTTLSNTPTTKSKPNTPKNSDDSTIEHFSKFDFSSGVPVPTYLQNKRKPSKAQLLKKVQEQKKILHELHGTEEGDALARQEAWDTMKKKAQGEKIKNDPEKLKKSIKRDMQQKKKSKREWDQRVSLQKKSQKEAQKKRQENIEKLKERKRDKRQGIKRKKTSSTKTQRRGFEGEKKHYLNK
eukprot:TRINITY_DN2061_c0_g1_i3.p1 TRINITY_DN2061_c0_g1~~TRINITY_DN2061_c0_g1_i3.p1  ORF type:complete len:373 (+),score=122.65 TRINITY_DN2061_c0_g1_i3:30-1148(+)